MSYVHLKLNFSTVALPLGHAVCSKIKAPSTKVACVTEDPNKLWTTHQNISFGWFRRCILSSKIGCRKWFCYPFICWFQLTFHFFFALTWAIILKFNGAKQMAASKARKLNWQFFPIHWSPNACFLLWSLWLSSTWRYGSDFLGFFVVGHLWPPVEEHHTTSEAER